MARFLDLPNELILQVIDSILPEDLENFAQSCKRCRSVADDALRSHRQLIRRYTIMKNGKGRTISSMLKEVLIDPVIGRYIKHLSLSYIAGSKRNLTPTYSAEDLELFVAASEDSQFLSPRGQNTVTCYRDIIERANEDILLAILLPLLPNLKSLRFPRVSNDGDHCWTSHMFSHLPHHSTPTLTNLSTVCINVGRVYLHLDEAKAYANLPSVKSLSAPMLCSEICDDASLLWASNSTITNLELWQCRVPARPLHDFLLGFHCLESFAYSCDLQRPMTNEFDAFLIRSALLAKAKKTLRKLTIFSYRPSGNLTMGTLRPFEVLNEVEMDWELLLPHNPLRRDPSLDFAASLPNSLRKLTLHDRIRYGRGGYSELLGSAVQANTRGMHVHPQPQPHENLAQFEWGLQLQELIIVSEMEPIDHVEIHPSVYEFWAESCHQVGIPSEWYGECKKVGIALGYRVQRTKESEERTRRRDEGDEVRLRVGYLID